MAYESFDNINQLELQAVIEAEINLFENTRSTNTYTNMEAPTFQEQFQPNFLQQQQQPFQLNSLEQASTPTLPSPLQGHSIGKKNKLDIALNLRLKFLASLRNLAKRI